MSALIRILYVDDYPLDRELVRDALTKETNEFELVEAASRDAFEVALAQGGFDLVLSDFNILGFEGLQVLNAVRAKDPDVPVIIVTGTGSEEVAVEAMKQGAADYVIKKLHHIQRLPMTIHAILDKKRVELERREINQRYQLLFENSAEAILLTDMEGSIFSANPAACQVFQMSEAEIKALGFKGIADPADGRLLWLSGKKKQTGKFLLELNLTRKDGTIFPAEISTITYRDMSGLKRKSWMIRDITERKLAENRISRQLEFLTALRVIDQTIASTFDLHFSLNILLANTISLLSIDAACVFLLNPKQNILEYTAGIGFITDIIKAARIKLGEGLVGRAALERRLVQYPEPGVEMQDLWLAAALKGENFLSYYGVPLIAKGKVIGVLGLFHRSLKERDQEWMDFLNTLAGQAAIAIDNAQLFDRLQRSNLELSQAYDATIEGWSRALDLRDRETEGHTLRVVELTLNLARRMGLSDGQLIQVHRGALLHDIGKLGVPDGILLKSGPLTDEEWALMRKHPLFAFEMLSPIKYLADAVDIPYCHHEKWDGTGYPRGLKREQIPLTARIFAVVDVFDALTSDRPYRRAWSREQTMSYIKSLDGIQFDPRVVQAFLEMIQ